MSHASVVWLKITNAGFGVYLMSAIRDLGFEIDGAFLKLAGLFTALSAP